MPAEFFDAMYAQADGDDSKIPWQHAVSRHYIGDWLASIDPSRFDRALVVAAGLGDDAAALADLGLDVVAFDQAPSAIDWARRRHPGAAVDWQVADLFDPPAHWLGGFDLVVEVFTVQSIPPDLQARAAAAVRGFVAPGGTLVAVALVHDGSIEPEGPPWPLHPATLEVLGDGLTERSRASDDVGNGITGVRVELVRPE